MIETLGMKESLLLYFIMGSHNTPHDPLWVLQEAIQGGITCFQFREKGEGATRGAEKVEWARALQEICRASRIPFLVDDEVDLALFLDAEGVHIGQEDGEIEEVRRKIGSHKILGVSIHTVEEAHIAQEKGADYLGVGPIYPTSSKKDAKEPVGPAFIRELRDQGIHLPIVGIGGITRENAARITEAGADGIALISAICQAQNPREEAALLRKEAKLGIDRRKER